MTEGDQKAAAPTDVDHPAHLRHRKRPTVWTGFGRPALSIAALALVVVLVSGGTVAAVGIWKLSSAVTNNAVDISNGSGTTVEPPPSIGPFDGGFNVLAVGADNAPGQADGDERHDATLNDVNILLHVSADHQSAVALSLPRDLVIPQPACVDPATGEDFSAVSAQPLNSAYGRGGLGCVVSAVEELTGLTIPYAAEFTFAGTVAMSDAVGGVPICLDSAVVDPESGLDLPAGTSVVSGQQALSYLRARSKIGDGSDLSRISSQQAYMSSLMRVMKSSNTLTNPGKVLGLATAAAENVALSTSLAHLTTMASMAVTLKDLDLSRLVFVQYPSLTDPDNENKIVPNEDLAAELLAKIQADQPFGLDDASLGSEVTIDASAPPADPGAVTSAPEPTDFEVIGGLRGQTADQQTCSLAYHY